MIFNVDNTAKEGKPVDYIEDGTGTQYRNGLLWIDTDTGELRRHIYANGRPVLGTNLSPITEVLRLALPITVAFKNGKTYTGWRSRATIGHDMAEGQSRTVKALVRIHASGRYELLEVLENGEDHQDQKTN